MAPAKTHPAAEAPAAPAKTYPMGQTPAAPGKVTSAAPASRGSARTGRPGTGSTCCGGSAPGLSGFGSSGSQSRTDDWQEVEPEHGNLSLSSPAPPGPGIFFVLNFATSQANHTSVKPPRHDLPAGNPLPGPAHNHHTASPRNWLETTSLRRVGERGSRPGLATAPGPRRGLVAFAARQACTSAASRIDKPEAQVLMLCCSSALKGPKQESPGGGNPVRGVGPGVPMRMSVLQP